MNTQGRVGRCGTRRSRLAIGSAVFMVAALPLSTTDTAQGDIVTLHVSGTVTSIDRTDPENFDLDGSVAIGSPYQLTFAIDTDAPDSDPDPVWGRFQLAAASGQLGSYAWSRTVPPVYGIETVNDLADFVDEYHLEQQNPGFAGTFIMGGVPTPLTNESFEFLFAGIGLRDFSTNALDSDALVIPSLSDWGTSRFVMHFSLNEAVTGIDSHIVIEGTVDSITTPEPGSATVVGLLLTVYTVKRRDRNYSCSREIISSA